MTPQDLTMRDRFERMLVEKSVERYVLKLYVTGMTSRSTDAVATIRAICHDFLEGRYDLDVIDIYEHPEMASKEQIVAAPTLIKELPAPRRRMIGNLADRARVLRGLDLPARDAPPRAEVR